MKKIRFMKSKNKFVNNVLLLASGTAGAQMIVMLASPIITRLYGAEAFGILGTFNAMANILIPVAALTYPIAIVLPKKDEDAKSIIQLSIFISFFIAVVLLILLMFFHNSIINLFNLTEVSLFIFLLPLVVIFAGLMQTAKQWLIRKNKFYINAKAVFYQSVITNSSIVAFGFFYPLAFLLILISSLNNGIRAFIMYLSIKSENKINFQLDNIKYLKMVAKKYYDFPLFRAPESLLTGVSHSAPVLMLSAFFGPASAGFYAIGRRVLSIPTQLIGEAVGDVFYPKVTEEFNNKEDISKTVKKATLLLSVIGILPFSLVIIFGPFLFGWVFGEEWIKAGEYARWIAIWSFTNFINKPSGRTLAVISAQRYHLIYTFFGLIVKVSALSVGFYVFKDDMIAVSLFGISSALLNIGLISMTLILCKRKYNIR